MADKQPTDATEPINQGATGEGPTGEQAAPASSPGSGEQAAPASSPGSGETPLSVESEADLFAERPEAYVGAAFAGGLALAMILRRFTR